MTKNSPFLERLTHNVSQRSEPSRTATAYRCSPGRRGSFISPTFGVAKLSFLPLSNMSRQSANSSGASVAASKPWYRSHPSKVSRSSSLMNSCIYPLGVLPAYARSSQSISDLARAHEASGAVRAFVTDSDRALDALDETAVHGEKALARSPAVLTVIGLGRAIRDLARAARQRLAGFPVHGHAGKAGRS